VDLTLLWVGVGLALAAAVLLAFVPRLPSAESPNGFGLAGGSLRITPGTNRRLRLFAVTQIAASFVLLAGAGMLLTALIALQTSPTGFKTDNVLAIDVPVVSYARKPAEIYGFYKEAIRRLSALPGVDRVAVGAVVLAVAGWGASRLFAPKPLNIELGKSRQVTREPIPEIHVAISPDGREVAYQSG
jgi:hypothetical protein